MRNLLAALFVCLICLCCSRISPAQGIYGSTELDIDQDSGTVTATCYTEADNYVVEYYKTSVSCVVEDSNNNIVASGGQSDDSGQGYVQVVLTFTGVPGETYTAISSHSVVAIYTVVYYPDPSQPIRLHYYDDMYGFSLYSEDPGLYEGSYEWESPGPETYTATSREITGNTEAMATDPQIPTSLKVLSVTVLPTGTSGNSGCTPSTGDFGIKVDIKYQVLDQAGQPLKQGGMTPYEAVQFAGGPASYNPIGPTGNSNSTATTASDGTFHDVPLGLCSNGSFSNLTELQIIYIDSTSQKVRKNAFTYNSGISGHGTISNGADVDASR